MPFSSFLEIVLDTTNLTLGIVSSFGVRTIPKL